MIPKIIHYCWFGPAEMPVLVQSCITSWRKHLPDYEFMFWNENNFDLNSISFTKEAYLAKKYAFVTDYVRVFALEKYGGIYLDTDIEVIKSFNDLLESRAILGFEDGISLTALMGCEKHHPLVCKLLSFYKFLPFNRQNGSLEMTTFNVWMERILKEDFKFKANGCKQMCFEGIEVFPCEFFHAKSLVTGELMRTDKTYAIHHHTLLWISKKTKIVKFFRQNIFVPLFGRSIYIWVSDIVKKMIHA